MAAQIQKTLQKSSKMVAILLAYTFGITWLFWSIIILANFYFQTLWYGEPFTWILYTIGGLGPATSAYIIYRKFGGEFYRRSFIDFVFGQKITLKAWLIFIVFTVWRFLMIWLAFEVGRPVTILFLLAILVNLPFVILLGGLEELVWRGILQPKLEKIFGYLPSILGVGVLWSLWHLPLWLIKGTIQSQLPFGLYLAAGLILSFSFTTFYKYTKNLFLTIFSHAWFNLCIGLAVYINSDGLAMLNLNWKVWLVFGVEFVVSLAFGVLYKVKL